MDDGIPTGSAHLVTLRLAVGAAGVAAAHVSTESDTEGRGLHQTVEYASGDGWYGATLSPAGIRTHSTG